MDSQRARVHCACVCCVRVLRDVLQVRWLNAHEDLVTAAAWRMATYAEACTSWQAAGLAVAIMLREVERGCRR